MQYYECPNKPHPEERLPISVYLAGGITGCPNWQQQATEYLKDLPIALFNPRRKEWAIVEEEGIHEQISWEFEIMKNADVIIFYFPMETLCPIALYELGRYNVLSMAPQGPKLFIATHPEYERRLDLQIQTHLANSETVHDNLYVALHEAEKFIKDIFEDPLGSLKRSSRKKTSVSSFI